MGRKSGSRVFKAARKKVARSKGRPLGTVSTKAVMDRVPIRSISLGRAVPGARVEARLPGTPVEQMLRDLAKKRKGAGNVGGAMHKRRVPAKKIK